MENEDVGQDFVSPAEEEDEDEVSDSSFETDYYKTTPITTIFPGIMEDDTQYAVTSDFFKDMRAQFDICFNGFSGDRCQIPYKRPMIKLKKVDLKKLEERIEKKVVELLEKKFEERRKEENAIREKENAILEKKNAIFEKKNAIREKKNAIREKQNDIREKQNAIREKQFSFLKRKVTILQDKTVILAKQSSNFENMNTLLEAKLENRVKKLSAEKDLLVANINCINKQNTCNELEIEKLRTSINDLEERITLNDLKTSLVSDYNYDHPDHLA